jgi:hypothetical protein
MMLNEGNVDRVVRVPKTWLGWFGVVPLLTGLVGVCPLYRLVGFRTTKAT